MKSLKSKNPRIQRLLDYWSGWREVALCAAFVGAVAVAWLIYRSL